ncbi:PstS family phosphate ABC transporter substrate-binding protein [Aureimonas jatrophae]|uniref:Phosphate ABC transporter substrate-binding protein, PhoT family n=1 Tax=Aureimonas jatrophae TaxID=1166073 RepID=A0A1H0IF63_9HYPH|nr:substrate-binding domain-containing protein [Aureimonas jatrophae]MBB3952136.1 phosphate transport system substrate-binding protein [Aureimonas jatrophae]SDO30054.1 phosphate ABC transporter substrate-binding protein, PhoT family [Aureimonas jatrophae]
MLKTSLAALALGTALAATSALAQNAQPIQVAGSSTVLPYAQIVAENFGEVYPDYPTPVVESGGTGAGLKQFCSGVGPDTIDVANASRPISESEKKTCMDNGVTEIQEVKFGYDGIVFATAAGGSDWKLTPTDVFNALGAKLVSDGKLVDNPNKTWKAANPALPDWNIAAYIPGSKHGTREVFETKLIEAGCKATGTLDAYKASGMDDKAAAAACLQVRKDGAAVDIDGDYTETLARIDANKQGVGVFGLAFYEQNQDKLQVATVNDVVPSVETISTGQYPVSRPLFFYVKKAHIGVVPGLKEYADFFLSEQMIGPDSPLATYGLVPAPDAERETYRADFDGGKTM